MDLCPVHCPWDTCKTQGTDERRFFSGDLERLWVQEQPCFGTEWQSFPQEAGQGKESILLLQASASWLQKPQPHFGSSGLWSLLAVVVEVVHGEGGCDVGTGVPGDTRGLSST